MVLSLKSTVVTPRGSVSVNWKCLDGIMRKVPGEIIYFVDVNEQLFPYAGSISGWREGEGTYTV
jgi:hypothetical protein